MTNRAAILPYPGDPFLLQYWLKFFYKYWYNEVDKLYIYLNSPVEKPVVDFIRWLCTAPNINFQYEPNYVQHGDAINRTLDIVEEKYVMLIEDDGFIFRSGMVDRCFRYLESGQYDIVGSKRGSCSYEILHAARAKWGIGWTGLGDQGCNFWPCYFFSEKELLLKTDRNFNAKQWEPGERIEALDLTVGKDPLNGDTFVNTSLQLHALVPTGRIMYVPQYHGHPDDLDHYTNQQFLFDGQAPWTHVGSLSSGLNGVLTDNQGRPLSRRLTEPPKPTDTLPNYCNTEMERKEWERRVQWWSTFYQEADPKGIEFFHELYGEAITRICNQYKLSTKAINRRMQIYKTLYD